MGPVSVTSRSWQVTPQLKPHSDTLTETLTPNAVLSTLWDSRGNQMTEVNSDHPSQTYTDRVRDLNDTFRKTLQGGTVLFTAGILSLGNAAERDVLNAIAVFDDFEDDNDPHGEHDFGCIEVQGQKVFFKIDYFDQTQAYHSEDPGDPSVTQRVMTVMLASEW
jgi:hypothetical protein